MKRAIAVLPLLAALYLSSCAKKETTETPAATAEAPKPAGDAAQAPETAPPPRASILLKDGSKVPGTIVASSATDMVVAGDDGIERKIPLNRIKSVEYGDTQTAQSRRPSAPAPARPTSLPKAEPAAPPPTTAADRPTQKADAPVLSPAPPPPVTTKTFELPSGSEISVRTDEAINSETATEGQTFDAQVTRDAVDANGDVVIPRRSPARIVIRSASQGGRIRGASDLVLDLQSVTINGKQHALDTADVTKRGASGVGANKRTAGYTGGGAAVGAIIGAIAGGGKGAAIGAGAGAGAGALAQVLTKGRSIKVPAETVLTFSLDKPLKVAQLQ